MKRKVRTVMNIVLGFLTSFFAGCHAQKVEFHHEKVICKYGIPREILDQRSDTISKPMNTSIDTLETEGREGKKYPTPLVKYGPREV